MIALAPGNGTVSALYHGRLLTAVVTVLGKAPTAPVYTLESRFAPYISGQDAKTSRLIVRVADNTGKPLANAPITLVFTGGTSTKSTRPTDFDGSATFDITWTDESGGAVRVLCGTLTPNALNQP